MCEYITQYDLYNFRLNISFISEYNLIEIILNRLNRSNHEIVSDILRAIDTDGATIYEMQFKTCISYQHLKKYLTYLVQNELIVYRKEEKKFRMTQRGIHAVNMYTKMDELLGRKTRHNMTKTIEYVTSFP